jgi:hypothetical protein
MGIANCDHGFSKQREYRAKLAAKGDSPTPVAAFTVYIHFLKVYVFGCAFFYVWCV